MDDLSKIALSELKQQNSDEVKDRHLATNFLGASALLIALATISTFIMWMIGIPILLPSDTTIISAVMDVAMTVGIIVFCVSMFKMIKSTFTGMPESYSDIIFGATIATIARLIVLSNLEFTVIYITVILALVTLCISIWGIMSFIESAQEESSIIRFIYYAGKTSQQGVINSLRSQRDRYQSDLFEIKTKMNLAVEDGDKNNLTAIFLDGTRLGINRSQAASDALQYYDLVTKGEKVSVKLLNEQYMWTNAQNRAREAFERLTQINAINNDKQLLNRDRLHVEQQLAKQIMESVLE